MAVVMQPQPDRSVLAGRIQGFGNVNPPPLQEDTAGIVAKRAVGRLGEMIGEEVVLQVQDFKEKGAVGVLKDTVADAGDILIDGAFAIVGWVRGDPLIPEEENAAAADVEKVLEIGPTGAAYGISQASPTGGINAVWVMPDEADETLLAELAQQQQQYPNSPSANIPPGIQPYAPPGGRQGMPQFGQVPQTLPNGTSIAPYQPNAPKMQPFQGGFQPALQGGAVGFQPAFAGQIPPAGAPTAGTSDSSIRALIEQVSTGHVLPGPEVARRLQRQCTACKLVDALCQLDSPVMKDAVKDITEDVGVELLSLQDSAQHKDVAMPMLQNVGLLKKVPDTPELLSNYDLLGAGPLASNTADLLDSNDLLGAGASPATATDPSNTADLLDSNDLLGAGPSPATTTDLLA